MLRLPVQWRFLIACGCACLWATSPAAGQSGSSMFGASSMSSRSTSGSTSMSGGSLSSMGSAFGSSGMGNLANMMGGQSGMGGGMNGMSGMNGMMGNNRGATGMGNQGNQGNFVGRNTNQNQFIGSNNMTGANTGQLNNRTLQNALGNRNSSTNPNGTQNTTPQTPALRARQKIGFDYARPQGVKLQSQVQSRFAKLMDRNASMKGITFSTDETGAVVLQGGVPSESAAKLAEKLVRLEPGVKAVRSELTYPTASAE